MQYSATELLSGDRELTALYPKYEWPKRLQQTADMPFFYANFLLLPYIW